MARTGKGRTVRGKGRITDVRMVDSAAGRDGPMVDRMISAVKETESQVRIIIGDVLDVFTATTGGVNGTYDFNALMSGDEWSSMIQQFNLFRVRAIKFDIVDVNPSQPVLNTFGTFHDNTMGTVVPYTRANIADLPDSRVLSGGTGQTTLYWVAHGTTEMGFQAATSLGTPSEYYGGLKYFLGQTTTATPKYTITVHAVVDFRGRR